MMDMQVDSQLIRAEREQRAWSQEHLANVSGLGLRTVQRIESTGRASYESASAIAAAFSMPVSELRIGEIDDAIQAPVAATKRRWISARRTVVSLSAFGVLLAAGLGYVMSRPNLCIYDGYTFSVGATTRIKRVVYEDGEVKMDVVPDGAVLKCSRDGSKVRWTELG